ncbi:hypothetical protein G7K_3450-t1 [Saitoella complicata NRRL Y-17804]|uniref:Uncharacterized protein n=1 Tax=Saitoella complicata (strain BCRC 22490 / CBS 7301 / JCM 7358 / NBRC 10748 / NRRL Y-17804) TaxID=698492 RepID=A0A0E9NHI6_SAICN|nr:hypothetical protein G7K_3450-t1 [Saitoella complicata NRRL Y-17804]
MDSAPDVVREGWAVDDEVCRDGCGSGGGQVIWECCDYSMLTDLCVEFWDAHAIIGAKCLLGGVLGGVPPQSITTYQETHKRIPILPYTSASVLQLHTMHLCTLSNNYRPSITRYARPRPRPRCSCSCSRKQDLRYRPTQPTP